MFYMYTHVCGPAILQFTLAQIQYGRGPYPYLSIHIIPFPYHSTFTSIHSWHGSIQVPSFKRFWQVTKFIFELNAWQFGHTLQCQLLLVDRVTFKERPSGIHSGWNKDLSSDERQCTSRTMSAKGSWSYRTFDDVPQKRLPLNAMYLTGHGFSFLSMKYWIDQNKLIGHDLAWDAIVASAFWCFEREIEKNNKKTRNIYLCLYSIPLQVCQLKWQETDVKVASAGRPCAYQVLVMWRSCPCSNILAPFFSRSIALIIRATSKPVVAAESLKSKQLPSRPITWSSTASLSPMGSMAWFAFVCVGFCFLGKTSSGHSYQWAVVTQQDNHDLKVGTAERWNMWHVSLELAHLLTWVAWVWWNCFCGKHGHVTWTACTKRTCSLLAPTFVPPRAKWFQSWFKLWSTTASRIIASWCLNSWSAFTSSTTCRDAADI